MRPKACAANPIRLHLRTLADIADLPPPDPQRQEEAMKPIDVILAGYLGE